MKSDIDIPIPCKACAGDGILPLLITLSCGIIVQSRILIAIYFYRISLGNGNGDIEGSVFRNVDLNSISHILSIHRVSNISFCPGSGCNSKSHLIRLFIIKADRSSAAFLKASNHTVVDFCTVIDRVSDPGNDFDFLLLAILFPMHNGLLKGVVSQLFRQTCVI